MFPLYMDFGPFYKALYSVKADQPTLPAATIDFIILLRVIEARYEEALIPAIWLTWKGAQEPLMGLPKVSDLHLLVARQFAVDAQFGVEAIDQAIRFRSKGFELFPTRNDA